MVARFQTLFSIVNFTGKSDTAKQQYWLYVSMQKSAASAFTPCNCPNSELMGNVPAIY